MLGTVTLIAAAAGLGVVLWLYLGDWRLLARRLPAPPPLAALDAAIDDSRDDLRDAPDARLAIRRCYARFERLLAVAGSRRAPWQTAGEFMRAALARQRLPGDAVAVLTALFERARFSRQPLGDADRDAALAALAAIRIGLDRQGRDRQGRDERAA